MKTVFKACWTLCVTAGNVIVAVVTSIKLIEVQSLEYLLYTCLLIVATIFFTILSYNYEYANDTVESDSNQMELHVLVKDFELDGEIKEKNPTHC